MGGRVGEVLVYEGELESISDQHAVATKKERILIGCK